MCSIADLPHNVVLPVRHVSRRRTAQLNRQLATTIAISEVSRRDAEVMHVTHVTSQ